MIRHIELKTIDILIKRLILVLLFIVFLFLSFGSLFLTLNHINYETLSYADNLLLEIQQGPYVIIGSVLFLGFVLWLAAFLTKNRIRTEHVLYITLTYTLFASVILNVLLRNGVEFDQKRVLEFAREAMFGNFWGLYKGQYISSFPYLFGLALYEMVVISLADPSNIEKSILILQLFNSIELTLCVFFGYKILQRKHGKFILVSYCLLSISFLPIFLYTSFLYNEIVSFMFIYAALFYTLDYFDRKKIISFILCTIFISLAIILRLNSLIVLIAIVMVFIYKGIFDKAYINMGLIIVLIGSVFALTKAPIKYFEKASNYYSIVDKNDYQLDDGMPYIGNIAMGTRVTHFNYYGWFDGTNNYVYITLCNFDSSKAKEEYKKIIKESYDYAINNPLVFGDYMFRKTASIWMDPIFDVLYFTGFNRIKDSFVSDFLYYGSGKQLLKILSDIYQSAIYLLCLARLIELFRNIKETKIEELLLYIIILGGFLFHLFWEVSSRYTLPYFFISIMCAAEGLHYVYNSFLNKRVKS